MSVSEVLLQSTKILVNSSLPQETKEVGTLSMQTLKAYWNATGGILALFVAVAVIAMQVSRNLSDVWLAHWVSQSNNSSANQSINYSDVNDDDSTYYLKVYAAIAVINSFITLLRAFAFAYAGVKAAKNMHNTLLYKIFSVSNLN